MKTLKQLLRLTADIAGDSGTDKDLVWELEDITYAVKKWLTQKRQELKNANTSKQYYTNEFIDELTKELEENKNE